MKERSYPKNDGWNDVDYKLVADPARNEQIKNILNEACHVFHHHAEGTWRSSDKDTYSKLIAVEIAATPSLAGKLLMTGDRVIKMLTYRAIQLNKEKKNATVEPA